MLAATAPLAAFVFHQFASLVFRRARPPTQGTLLAPFPERPPTYHNVISHALTARSLRRQPRVLRRRVELHKLLVQHEREHGVRGYAQEVRRRAFVPPCDAFRAERLCEAARLHGERASAGEFAT